jgi:hypothetical protein
MDIYARTASVLSMLCCAGAALAQTSASTTVTVNYRYALGDSQWIQVEKQQAGDALAQLPAHVLIAPFRVDGDSFDAIERSLLARTVAAAIRDASGLTVADVSLVERALGTAVRSFSSSWRRASAPRRSCSAALATTTRVITAHV